jgi:hypothetical protein
MTHAAIAEKKSWLVMIYIAADDVREEKDNEESLPSSIVDSCEDFLDRIKVLNINQPDVHVVALYDVKNTGDAKSKYSPSVLVRTPEKTWQNVSKAINDKYGIFFNSSGNGKCELLDTNHKCELNSGHYITLAVFVRWSLDNYLSDKTILIVVGHGGGWAPTVRADDLRLSLTSDSALIPDIIYKNGTHSPGLNGICVDESSDSAISTPELRLALDEGLQGRRLNNARARLDILFLDACLMGMVEVAYELRDYVDYLVAGQNLMLATLAYDTCLDSNNLKSDTKPGALAALLVSRYSPETEMAWCASAINTAYMRLICDKINQLAANLIVALSVDDRVRKFVREAYESIQKFDYRARSIILDDREGYVDLWQLLNKLLLKVNFNKIKDKIDGDIKKYQELADSYGQGSTAKEMLERLIREMVSDRRRIVQIEGQVEKQIQNVKELFGEDKCIIKYYRNPKSGKNDYDLRLAKGLSIYLPGGEDDNRNDSKTIKYLRGKRHLELYVEQLLFARDAPEWASLLSMLIPKPGRRAVASPEVPRPYQTPRLLYEPRRKL